MLDISNFTKVNNHQLDRIVGNVTLMLDKIYGTPHLSQSHESCCLVVGTIDDDDNTGYDNSDVNQAGFQ